MIISANLSAIFYLVSGDDRPRRARINNTPEIK